MARIDPNDLVAGLARRGLRRLLVEGGSHTVSAFLAAGALHRLHVCVSPVLIGSGPTGLCLPPIARMEQAMRPSCTTHRLGDDVLFEFDPRARGGMPGGHPPDASRCS